MASSTATTIHPRIAIIGGGPGGLILLLTLHRRGIPATLYEREASISARAHMGGMLDLGYESGQRAFRENGLEDAFKRSSRPEAHMFKMCDGSGKVLLQGAHNEGTDDPKDLRPEIDRSVLRKIIVDAVSPDAIKWGHSLASVRPVDGSGQHELTFTNGFTTTTDILIGADGAYSRVRPLLSPAVPLYHDVTGAEISLSPSTVLEPDLRETREMVGEGSTYAVQNERMFAFQRNGDGRIRVYAWFRGSADWALPKDVAEARRALLDKYEGWAPWMLKAIERCDEEAMYTRPLYYLEVGHRWEHVDGVTLIGDAAHLMSPFAGAGANLAMVDGLELGILLAEGILGGRSVEEREARVAKWEEKMIEDAGKVAKIASDNLEGSLHPSAPQSLVEDFQKFMDAQENRRTA